MTLFFGHSYLAITNAKKTKKSIECYNIVGHKTNLALEQLCRDNEGFIFYIGERKFHFFGPGYLDRENNFDRWGIHLKDEYYHYLYENIRDSIIGSIVLL